MNDLLFPNYMIFRLLDVLAQRKDPFGLKDGLVLLNGEKPPNDFRLMSGYVVQVGAVEIQRKN